jgi:hypothetical protein
LCLVFVAAGYGFASAASDAEDTLKAVAVWGFLRYSEWPHSSDGTITVGVLGRPTFLPVLHRTLDGKAVHNRPVRVIDYAGDAHCCQLLYFATNRVAEIRQVLQNTPPSVLTIGEDDRFLDSGGVVSLFIDDGHIAFETSLKALNRSGISVSASLLRLGQLRDMEKRK